MFENKVLIALITGILSSLLAIGIYECFKKIYRKLDERKLKAIIGLKNKKSYLIAPIYPNNRGEKRIKYKNAYAFGHILELNYRIERDPQIIPADNMPEFDEISDIVSLGKKSNSYTAQIISDYDIDFNTTSKDEVNEFEKPIGRDKFTGFKIGGETYAANDKTEPAVIIKLTEDEINESRTILLIIGYSAQGTAAAAYYLKKEYRKIYKSFKDKKFYILINASRRESYKIYKKDFIDLTDNLK
jgi:hypothetical protein